MRKRLIIKIIHLYPDMLNLYGDIGNIFSLTRRAEWRGIKVELKNVKLNDLIPTDGDIYFIGGGQDIEEFRVYLKLKKNKSQIFDLVNNNTVFLCVCAGFQLFGKYFITGDGKQIEGLGVINAETKAPDSLVKSRCIGNLVAQLNENIIDTKGMPLKTIVGFENHGGQTYLGKEIQPLAKVIKGFGNNSKEKIEGAVYKNVFCTYCHGSFLPKNPHFADYLIKKAIEKKYKLNQRLEQLDDYYEIAAHKFILEKEKV